MAQERSSQRLSRLLNLVAALSETHVALTARQIREKVDGDYGDSDATFRRQFERDKKELRELGIEIAIQEVYDEDRPEAGYRVPRSQYVLRLPDLDADEAAALQLAASLVRLDGTQGGAALWKLGAAGSGGAEVEGIAAVPAHEQLGPLFTAVAARRPARFGYRGVTRFVDPFRLDFARGRWYLLAHDRDRGASRWFRLDRMEGAPELGPAGSATLPPEGTTPTVPDPWALGDAEAVRARVTVDAVQAPLARAVLGEAAVIEESDDGAVVVELDVSHRDGFRSFLLGFLEHAEVLSPPELRAEIVAWLSAIAARRARAVTDQRRTSAAVRLRRLLSMIPWLAANDGPSVLAVCERFRITEAELRRDLELLSNYVGVPPYTPDQLFHLTVERGRVFARMTPTFDRPLRLTPEEGVALVVASRALTEVEGAEPDGPLARALAKVAGVLGIDPDEAIDVDLGTAAAPTLAVLRAALEAGRQVEIDHYSHGRDERHRRVVDPWAVANEAGAWYLVGWDHLRGAERSFRIDRVLSARILELAASPAPDGLRPSFSAADADPRVTLRLQPEARWVVESYPVEETRELGDGRLDVTMAVTGRAWLERLLLRLGAAGSVVVGPDELREAGSAVAAWVLRRYASPGP